MEKNIIKILSDNKLFAWYFNNRNCILIIGMIVLVIIAICMTKIIIRKVGKIEYKIIYGKPMAHIIIAIIIGNGLNAAGLKLEFSIEHMPILLLSSAMLITVSIQLAECIRFYRNFERVIKRTNIIVIGIIESMVLLLAIMGRLEIIELLVAVVGNITLKIINTFIDNCTRIQRVKIIIDRERAEGDFNEKERRLIEHYMQVLQTRLIFGNSSNICILLGILHNEDFTGDFENKNIDSISQLCNIILKVNESFPLPEFNKADTELNTLKNYFERMKVEFSEERFSYAETEIMYFWEKVEYALEILEIWFGNFNSLNQDVTDLREYYDNVKGEFNQSALKNANNLTKALREVENYILAHPEDINPGGAFIKLLFDIEKIDKDNHDYWGKDKRKVIIALSNIYEKFEKTPVFIRAFGDRWIFCKIRLFQLRRNMNM